MVIETGENSGYGKYIKYKTDDGYEIMYAHLSAAQAEKGDKIKKGEEIAKSGNTGLSTGPHLHYTISLDGEILNPRSFTDY